MEYFYEILWGILGTVGTALATWLTSRLITWLNSKIKDQKSAKILTDITRIVSDAVTSVFQSFVDTLKKQGKFDTEAQKMAKERALEIINTQLTPELKTYITTNFGDIKVWLSQQVESVIYNLKIAGKTK